MMCDTHAALPSTHMPSVMRFGGMATPSIEDSQIAGVLDAAADATEYMLAHPMVEPRVAQCTLKIERWRAVAPALGETLAVLNANRPLQEILDRISGQTCKVLGAPTYLSGERIALRSSSASPGCHAYFGSLLP